MRFYDQLEADILTTFLNSNEFAEEHNIGDGNTDINCKMVISGAGNSSVLTGSEIRTGHISVFLETKNLPLNHSYGCSIFLDGEVYQIENEPINAQGMTELLLKRFY